MKNGRWIRSTRIYGRSMLYCNRLENDEQRAINDPSSFLSKRHKALFSPFLRKSSKKPTKITSPAKCFISFLTFHSKSTPWKTAAVCRSNHSSERANNCLALDFQSLLLKRLQSWFFGNLGNTWLGHSSSQHDLACGTVSPVIFWFGE